MNRTVPCLFKLLFFYVIKIILFYKNRPANQFLIRFFSELYSANFKPVIMNKIVFLLAALLVSVIVSAQTPDFSGSWTLNKANSKLNDQFSMAPKDIIVAHAGNDFDIEKHSSFQGNDFTIKDKFTLDGKECINPGWQDSQKKSTAVWSDDKLSLKITTKFPMGDNGEMTINELYKMNGSNLVVETTASSSFGDVAETLVFDKQ